MERMTKEQAKLIHLKARKRVLEERIEKAAKAGDAFGFAELSQQLDTIEFRIEVQENYLEEGFRTRVRNTKTVPSSIGNFTPQS